MFIQKIGENVSFYRYHLGGGQPVGSIDGSDRKLAEGQTKIDDDKEESFENVVCFHFIHLLNISKE